MTGLNRPAGLNRTVLAFFGLVLIAAGAFALLTHFGTLTVLRPESALVAETVQPPTWTLYAAAAASVVLGLLVLRWLVAQLTRKPKTHTWRLVSFPPFA
ncbi:hypothetical protein B0293_42660, partial [Amycolatopsis azurea DSM 43854]